MEKRRTSGLALAQLVGMLLIIAAHYGEHGEYGVIAPADIGGNVFFWPINYAAGSMLHVLIIHMNAYLRRWIWQDAYPNAAYAAWPYLHAPVKILCVFAGCLLVSMAYRATVRKWAGKALGKWKLLCSER